MKKVSVAYQKLSEEELEKYQDAYDKDRKKFVIEKQKYIDEYGDGAFIRLTKVMKMRIKVLA